MGWRRIERGVSLSHEVLLWQRRTCWNRVRLSRELLQGSVAAPAPSLPCFLSLPNSQLHDSRTLAKKKTIQTSPSQLPSLLNLHRPRPNPLRSTNPRSPPNQPPDHLPLLLPPLPLNQPPHQLPTRLQPQSQHAPNLILSFELLRDSKDVQSGYCFRFCARCEGG